jgi:hypothetical protein
MATSAKVTFFTVPGTPNNDFVLLLQNTSPAPFSIYAFLFGTQFGVPLIPPGPLANIQPISLPPGWSASVSSGYGFVDFSTNFAGSAASSGYILPGDVGTFVLASTTNPAPATLPFGCCFWNGVNEWGFAYNGEAQKVSCVPAPQLPPFWSRQEHAGVLPVASSKDQSLLPATGPGTTALTVRSQNDGPSVTLTFDAFGRVVKIVRNLPERGYFPNS